MLKFIFDFLLSILSLLTIGWLLVVFWIIASIDTRSNGLFIQQRIGQWGILFKIYKLKTMNPLTGRISSTGAFFRKLKIDEFPQLLNILFGEMSFVGPRPDISGYYDILQGEDRKILELKPGITSEASIKYRKEESILAQQDCPQTYNDKVIFPDKVQMNLHYYYNHSLLGDLKIIFKTIFRHND